MAETIKVVCAECGKEFDLDKKWQPFANKYPERVKCPSCKKGGGKSVAKAVSNTAKPSKSNYSKPTSATGKKQIDATMFKQAYDELVAEFGDNLDEVKEYLGGWTSTLVINRSK